MLHLNKAPSEGSSGTLGPESSAPVPVAPPQQSTICTIPEMATAPLFVQDHSAEDSADLPGVTPLPQPSGAQGGDSGAHGEKLDKGMMLCQICLKPCKRSRKRYGACCRKDCEAAESSALRQGGEEQAAWKRCYSDVAKWRQAVLEYKLSCPAQGRGKARAEFKFTRLEQRDETSVSFRRGFDGEFMSFDQFLAFQREKKKERFDVDKAPPSCTASVVTES